MPLLPKLGKISWLLHHLENCGSPCNHLFEEDVLLHLPMVYVKIQAWNVTNLVVVDILSEGLPEQADSEHVQQDQQDLLGQVDFEQVLWDQQGGSAILRTINSHLPYLEEVYIPVFSSSILYSWLASHWLKQLDWNASITCYRWKNYCKCLGIYFPTIDCFIT